MIVSILLAVAGQVGDGVAVSGGVRVVSAQEVAVERSENEMPEVLSVFVLEGGNLDLAFMSTDATVGTLLFDEAPCRYVRRTVRTGWCIVSGRVDTRSAKVVGPVMVRVSDLHRDKVRPLRPTSRSSPKSLENLKVLDRLRVGTYSEMIHELETRLPSK